MTSQSTMPQLEIAESTETYAKVVAEPLSAGFGTTIGNALRRVLLSSLPGAAVTAVRIDEVEHEFSTIPKMKEDTIEFLLNEEAYLGRYAPETDEPTDESADASEEGE